MGLESNFQSEALAYLNSLPGCRAENVSGNASQSGRPDITGCYRGRMFKLELKTPDHRNDVSKKQRLHLRRWYSAGTVVGVVYSMKALRALFRLDWDRCPEYHVVVPEKNKCISWAEIPNWGEICRSTKPSK